MSDPKRPAVIYLSPHGNESVTCDPELLRQALKYRMDKQLMKPEDFYRNITVWKFVHKDGTIEYYPRENDSDEMGFEKAVQIRKDKGMGSRDARKDAGAYPTNSGIHSEVNVVAEIYRRPDISQGLTRIEQAFTEREPCYGCRTFMRRMFPPVLHTPFFFYLPSSRTERNFRTKPYGGNVMLYLLSRYGA